jgi:hypothetical protein
MAQAMFEAVVGKHGSPPSPAGYRDLMAYSTATILMLITLVLATLQFADWLLAPPECLIANASSMSQSPTVSPASDRYPARPELAMKSSGCPCP